MTSMDHQPNAALRSNDVNIDAEDTTACYQRELVRKARNERIELNHRWIDMAINRQPEGVQYFSVPTVLNAISEALHGSTAEWLAIYFHLTREVSYNFSEEFEDTLCTLTGDHRFRRARWFIETFDLPARVVCKDSNYIFRKACAGLDGGQFAQWLIERFDLGIEAVISNNTEALRSALKTEGNFPFAQWLTRRFNLTAKDALCCKCDAFRTACKLGNLEVAQWLHAEFNLSSKSASSNNWEAFTLALNCGSMATARWVSETFMVPSSFVRSENNKAFRGVCASGHVEIATWLSRNFALSPEDARSCDNYAFRQACAAGHLEMAKWLVGEFLLTKEDVCAQENYAFRWAALGNHWPVMIWLLEEFDLTGEDVRSMNDFALRWACVKCIRQFGTKMQPESYWEQKTLAISESPERALIWLSSGGNDGYLEIHARNFYVMETQEKLRDAVRNIMSTIGAHYVFDIDRSIDARNLKQNQVSLLL